MIKKINLDKRKSFGRLDWLEHWNEPSGAKLIEEKINELVDAVNILQPAKDAMFYAIRNIQNRITALDDPTYHGAEPESVENVPGPIKLYVCADGSVYGNEDIAKSHAASISNQLPAGTTTTDRIYLEQELDRTRKALKIAVDALTYINTNMVIAENVYFPETDKIIVAQKALKQIKTALEQKE